MNVAPSGARFALKVLAASLLLFVLSLRGQAATIPQTIAALDSLTGDSTITGGNVVYVDFWASWCVPCRKSFPWMEQLVREYGDRGLQVIAINLDRDRAAAEKFLKQNGQNGTSARIVYDPDGKLAKLYDLQVMPSSFVYARDGTLKLQKQGFSADETASVEALIRKLIEEKPAP